MTRRGVHVAPRSEIKLTCRRNRRVVVLASRVGFAPPLRQHGAHLHVRHERVEDGDNRNAASRTRVGVVQGGGESSQSLLQPRRRGGGVVPRVRGGAVNRTHRGLCAVRVANPHEPGRHDRRDIGGEVRADAHESIGDGLVKHVFHAQIIARNADIPEPLQKLLHAFLKRRGGHRRTHEDEACVYVRERARRVVWRVSFPESRFRTGRLVIMHVFQHSHVSLSLTVDGGHAVGPRGGLPRGPHRGR